MKFYWLSNLCCLHVGSVEKNIEFQLLMLDYIGNKTKYLYYYGKMVDLLDSMIILCYKNKIIKLKLW